jgi:hypothetical protein
MLQTSSRDVDMRDALRLLRVFASTVSLCNKKTAAAQA